MNSLRTRLFTWYLGSLVLLAVFFYVVVHYLMLPHATHAFLIILAILAVVGYITIARLTNSLTYLSSEMKLITQANLDKRIKVKSRKDEIGELSTSFNNLLDRIDEAFRRERQLIGDVAHELKTPLATMQTSVEVALQVRRNETEYIQTLEGLLNDVGRLSLTLKNVLDLAWSDAPYHKDNGKVFSLSILMDELIEITQKMLTGKNIRLKSNVAKDIEIFGYRDHFARALLNILDNAVRYTNEGIITIDLQSIRGNIIINISDSGTGIDPKDVPHIFDRFYRGSTTQRISGTGIGLAIAKSIIALHKGVIHVESKMNVGSKFTITLPLDRVDVKHRNT